MKLLLFLSALILAGCGKFPDGTSVWQGGLWFLPWLTFLGSVFFGWKTWQQGKGSVKIEDGHVTDKPAGKQPFWELPYFYYSAGLFVATVIIIIMVNSEK